MARVWKSCVCNSRSNNNKHKRWKISELDGNRQHISKFYLYHACVIGIKACAEHCIAFGAHWYSPTWFLLLFDVAVAPLFCLVLSVSKCEMFRLSLSLSIKKKFKICFVIRGVVIHFFRCYCCCLVHCIAFNLPLVLCTLVNYMWQQHKCV